MIKKINIKKELTENEFENIITVCKREFKKVSDIAIVSLACEDKAKEITPSEEAYILFPRLESQEFEIISLGKSIPINKDKGGIIAECYNTKQPLAVNNITQSFLYKEEYDNFTAYPIKDMLTIPILDDSKQKNVLAILWASIPTGSLIQYTQKDIDYMVRFSIFIKRFLQQKELIPKKDDIDAKYLESIEAYNKLNAKIKREQEYFSNIIHDIRTPMNGVLGFLELLQLHETNAKQKEYIETALKSGESMVALINDALDISKMSSGKMSIENIEFSILEELGDVARLFYNSAKKKEITLNAFYDPDLPKIICSDYHRIKQIMNNLLNNAIKFTQNNGSISLELLYNKKIDGLTVSVKDNGIGIAKEMQRNIFTPYTQENNSTSREYGGTGLGLSISQQLAVLLGGKMELKSENKKGSDFYFTIPCNTKQGTASSVEKEKIKDISILIYNSKNRNIHLDTAKRYLDKFNLLTQETKEDEPLKNIRKNKFDILVILKKDTVAQEEEIQEILDTGKSVMIIDEDYFKAEHNWFVGKIETINSPLLPHDIFKTILKFTNYQDEKNEKTLIKLNKAEGKQILVVDDNAINLKFMREILKVFHIESILAHNAQESIKKFKDGNIDMIFMDENMPGMQGGEAIALIRKIEKENRLKHTIIIGLTGDADAKTKESMLSSGANDVLTKPIQLKEITNIIEKYL